MWQWPLTLLHPALGGRGLTTRWHHKGVHEGDRPLIMGNKVMMQNNEPWFGKLWQSILWRQNATQQLNVSILAHFPLLCRNYRKHHHQTLLWHYLFDLKITGLCHHQYDHRKSSHKPLGCHGKFRHHTCGRGLLVCWPVNQHMCFSS